MYLIITRSFPPDQGGMQNLMMGLAKNLSKFNLIKVFTDEQKNSLEHDANYSFSIERIKGIKLIRKYRKAFRVNSFLVENKNIKCVIADHWKSLEHIKTSKKKICLIHSKEINYDKGSRNNKRLLRVLNQADQIISNSEFTKNLAIDKGINSDLIKVINPGVDPLKQINKEAIEEAKKIINKKSPILITVSRFEKRKNHEKVIMSIRNLKQIYPNINYLCIGYGDEEKNLKQIVKELNLLEEVKFLKNVNQDLKNALISLSDVFVMPSIVHKRSVEGFGISFIEAAQHGIPSIGGKDGGAQDAIINNETGLICDGNKFDDVYESIVSILKDNIHKKLGVRAKENSKKFEWNNIIKEYLKIL